jgi:hypothetical protein
MLNSGPQVVKHGQDQELEDSRILTREEHLVNYNHY